MIPNIPDEVLRQKLLKKEAKVIYAARNGKIRIIAIIYAVPDIGYLVTTKERKVGFKPKIDNLNYYPDFISAAQYARQFMRAKCPRWRGYLQGPKL